MEIIADIVDPTKVKRSEVTENRCRIVASRKPGKKEIILGNIAVDRRLGDVNTPELVAARQRLDRQAVEFQQSIADRHEETRRERDEKERQRREERRQQNTLSARPAKPSYLAGTGKKQDKRAEKRAKLTVARERTARLLGRNASAAS